MRQTPERQPKIWGDPPLPPSTEVICNVTGARGVVGYYDSSVGQFPVRWPGGMWETCLAGDVAVATPPAPNRGRSQDAHHK